MDSNEEGYTLDEMFGTSTREDSEGKYLLHQLSIVQLFFITKKYRTQGRCSGTSGTFKLTRKEMKLMPPEERRVYLFHYLHVL